MAGYLDPERLTPGVIDGAAQHAFKTGACGALAIAIHDATGWPVVAITDAHNVHGDRAGGGSALHWAVQRPDGKLIDIDGPHDPVDLVSEYHGEADDGEAAWGISTKADVEEWYIEAQGEPIPVELARSFVGVVLALPGRDDEQAGDVLAGPAQ